jgi:predicted alpha/beta-hydrolase family hydrolase
MFHLTNIVDMAKDARSEANLRRLEIRDATSAVLIKRHVDGATIISPAMQEVIKEEKNQGFKKQNYYYRNKNYRRNSSVVFPTALIHQLFN